MDVELVLTINAEDRPGLVEAVASVITSHGGNWVDSAMSRLGGSFAGIIRVTLAEGNAEALEAALKELDSAGIEVSVRRGTAQAEVDDRRAHLELVGQDHTGIVLQVTKLLAAHKVNVEDMDTSVFTASMSGERMFHADAEISLPEGLSTDTLGTALEELAQDLMVEITLEDEG